MTRRVKVLPHHPGTQFGGCALSDLSPSQEPSLEIMKVKEFIDPIDEERGVVISFHGHLARLFRLDRRQRDDEIKDALSQGPRRLGERRSPCRHPDVGRDVEVVEAGGQGYPLLPRSPNRN